MREAKKHTDSQKTKTNREEKVSVPRIRNLKVSGFERNLTVIRKTSQVTL